MFVFAAGNTVAVAIWIRCVYALYQAAANRRDGVWFLTAFSTMSCLFRDSLYTPEGLRWAVIHLKCALWFLAIMGAEFLYAAITGRLEP
jgi:hypothetical protein